MITIVVITIFMRETVTGGTYTVCISPGYYNNMSFFALYNLSWTTSVVLRQVGGGTVYIPGQLLLVGVQVQGVNFNVGQANLINDTLQGVNLQANAISNTVYSDGNTWVGWSGNTINAGSSISIGNANNSSLGTEYLYTSSNMTLYGSISGNMSFYSDGSSIVNVYNGDINGNLYLSSISVNVNNGNVNLGGNGIQLSSSNLSVQGTINDGNNGNIYLYNNSSLSANSFAGNSSSPNSTISLSSSTAYIGNINYCTSISLSNNSTLNVQNGSVYCYGNTSLSLNSSSMNVNGDVTLYDPNPGWDTLSLQNSNLTANGNVKVNGDQWSFTIQYSNLYIYGSNGLNLALLVPYTFISSQNPPYYNPPYYYAPTNSCIYAWQVYNGYGTTYTPPNYNFGPQTALVTPYSMCPYPT